MKTNPSYQLLSWVSLSLWLLPQTVLCGQVPPPLRLVQNSTNLTISFGGRLQHAGQAHGPYTNVPGATTPFVVPMGTSETAFWRARRDGTDPQLLGQRIAVGDRHTVGIREDGTLWAWGANEAGQLGNGTCTDAPYPTQAGTNNHWKAVAAGYFHTIALQEDGTAWAWGYNGDGQLGDGTFTNRNAPILVGGSLRWKAIAAGGRESVGIREDGTLWEWGWRMETNFPVQIGTAANWSDVAVGDDHFIALQEDRTLWAWGGNASAQLGTGTWWDQPDPVQIGSASNWAAIAAGGTSYPDWGYSMALRQDGTLWGWGGNHHGQLGIPGIDECYRTQWVGPR